MQALRVKKTLPVRGATLSNDVFRLPKDLFQSTLPVRGATAGGQAGEDSHRFQSTLPVRGATDPGGQPPGLLPISIHAPREGSDSPAASSVAPVLHISIHAPREGSDAVWDQMAAAIRISIHAPREGSDGSLAWHCFPNTDFNPRSP